MEQAEALAESNGNYYLLVQIKIENRHDNEAALKIIDENINNLKEKVQCLQQYVPKLLKQKHDSSKKLQGKEIRTAINEKQVQ